MKVNKVKQGGPILFVAKDKSGQFLITRKALPRTHGNYRQASFHHAHMIHICYLVPITNYLITKLSVTDNFSACRNTLLKTACHFLRLLIGFNTLTY